MAKVPREDYERNEKKVTRFGMRTTLIIDFRLQRQLLYAYVNMSPIFNLKRNFGPSNEHSMKVLTFARLTLEKYPSPAAPQSPTSNITAES